MILYLQELDGNADNTRGKRSLRCKQCKKAFTVREDLAKHVRMYHGFSKKACSPCNIEFVSRKSYNLHMKLHDSKQLHNCNKCDYISYNKKNLAEHHLLHEGNHSLSEIANIQKKTVQSVPKEVDKCVVNMTLQNILCSNTTNDSPRKFCSSCNLEFFSLMAFRWHMKLHDSKSLHKCSKCEFISISEKSLSKHLLLHGKSASEQQMDKQELVPFQPEQEVIPLLHEQVTESTVVDKQKDLRVVLERRVESTLLKCSKCSQVLRNKKVLQNHQKYCIDDKSKLDHCTDILVRTRSRGVKYKSAGRSDSLRFNCTHCPFKTTRKYFIAAHIKKCHPGKK